MLKDADSLSITGWAQGEGYRIGFGEVEGTILPAREIMSPTHRLITATIISTGRDSRYRPAHGETLTHFASTPMTFLVHFPSNRDRKACNRSLRAWCRTPLSESQNDQAHIIVVRNRRIPDAIARMKLFPNSSHDPSGGHRDRLGNFQQSILPKHLRVFGHQFR